MALLAGCVAGQVGPPLLLDVVVLVVLLLVDDTLVVVLPPAPPAPPKPPTPVAVVVPPPNAPTPVLVAVVPPPNPPAPTPVLVPEALVPVVVPPPTPVAVTFPVAVPPPLPPVPLAAESRTVTPQALARPRVSAASAIGVHRVRRPGTGLGRGIEILREVREAKAPAQGARAGETSGLEEARRPSRDHNGRGFQARSQKEHGAHHGAASASTT
jgi:hypothetical protein